MSVASQICCKLDMMSQLWMHCCSVLFAALLGHCSALCIAVDRVALSSVNAIVELLDDLVHGSLFSVVAAGGCMTSNKVQMFKNARKWKCVYCMFHCSMRMFTACSMCITTNVTTAIVGVGGAQCSMCGGNLARADKNTEPALVS